MLLEPVPPSGEHEPAATVLCGDRAEGAGAWRCGSRRGCWKIPLFGAFQRSYNGRAPRGQASG